MAEFLLPFVILALLMYRAYKYFTEYFNYFGDQGLPFVAPVPVFGSLWGAWRGHNFHTLELERCQTLGPVYGMFWGRTPLVVVSEVELLKRIFVKDFDHFRNHVRIDMNDEYFNRILGLLDDTEWKEMRSIITPAFSTGKVNRLVPQLNVVAEALVKHLKDQPPGETVNIRTPVIAFVTDVMALCGFGVHTNSMENPDNPFIFNSGSSSAPKKQGTLLFTLGFLYPALQPWLRHRPGATVDHLKFYSDLARKLLHERRAQVAANPAALEHHDFLNVYLKAERQHPLLQDERMMVAQLVQILGMSGFDTTGFTICAILHCLAMSQSAQERARAELRRVMLHRGGAGGSESVNYELLSELTYLEQCIWETLRLYPVVARQDRVCTKEIDLGAVKLKKGMGIAVPTYAIHRNPKLYPDPTRFDPDRFSADVKATRDPVCFLPFGHGNRSCVATRFVLVKIKVALAHLLSNFRFVPGPETQDPPKISFGAVGFLTCNEFPLAIEPL